MLWEIKIICFYLQFADVVSQHKLSQLQVISDCGHVVNVERPQMFNHLSLDFLKSI